MHLKLSPVVEEGRRVGYRKSRLYEAQRDGLFPSTIKLGRTSLVPTHEVDAVVAARISGADDDAIRKLVAQLMASRTQVSATLVAGGPLAQAAA